MSSSLRFLFLASLTAVFALGCASNAKKPADKKESMEKVDGMEEAGDGDETPGDGADGALPASEGIGGAGEDSDAEETKGDEEEAEGGTRGLPDTKSAEPEEEEPPGFQNN